MQRAFNMPIQTTAPLTQTMSRSTAPRSATVPLGVVGQPVLAEPEREGDAPVARRAGKARGPRRARASAAASRLATYCGVRAAVVGVAQRGEGARNVEPLAAFLEEGAQPRAR